MNLYSWIRFLLEDFLKRIAVNDRTSGPKCFFNVSRLQELVALEPRVLLRLNKLVFSFKIYLFLENETTGILLSLISFANFFPI